MIACCQKKKKRSSIDGCCLTSNVYILTKSKFCAQPSCLVRVNDGRCNYIHMCRQDSRPRGNFASSTACCMYSTIVSKLLQRNSDNQIVDFPPFPVKTVQLQLLQEGRQRKVFNASLSNNEKKRKKDEGNLEVPVG